MKKNFWITLFLFSLSQAIFSNDSIASKVIIYRENNYQGSAISYKVFANDSLLVRLKNNSYYVYDCSPGEYDFLIDKKELSKVHFNVEKGKTYYLKFDMHIGFWTAVPGFLLVDSISATPIIYNSSMKLLGRYNTPYIRPKSRIGINIGVGAGFENNDMFEMENGKMSTFSYGGGVAYGLKYGYEFNKHLDLALDINYQRNDLSPLLTNASVSFSKTIFSITPSYIIPINGGDNMRLKLGAGVDYSMSNSFTIKSDGLGGFNDTWKYKNAYGYHASINYELNVSDNWSFNYGFKFYNIKYEFTSSNNSIPIVRKLIRPNASGFDFLCGIYYHF